MEHTTHQKFVLSRIMSILFIAMGVFLGISVFFVKAEPWEHGLDTDKSRVIAITGSNIIYPGVMKGISSDTSGNIVVVGSYEGSISFSGTQLLSSGGYDGFIVKMDTHHTPLWIRSINSLGDVMVYSHVQDNNGNIYLIGSFEQTASFGSTILVSTGDKDIFVAKLNKDGIRQRATAFGGQSSDEGFDIYQKYGILYAIGSFSETGYFGSIYLVSNGQQDVFVTELLGNNGNIMRATRAGGIGNDIGNTIAGSNQFLYIAGTFQGTGQFGSTLLTSLGADDIFVSKVHESGGGWIASESMGGSGNDTAFGITTDNSGFIHLVGSFEQTGYFGGYSLVSSGGKDGLVIKIASDLGVEHLKSIPNMGDSEGLGIITNTTNDVYVIGSFQYTGTFGSTTLVSSGRNDVFIAKLSSGYQRQRAIKGGGIYTDIGLGLHLQSSSFGDVLYSLGAFQRTGYFGSYQLSSSPGNFGAFVAKHVFDGYPPVFTGTTLTNILVTSGGIYNTGITITFYDPNLSGATLNGAPYISGSLILTSNVYVFSVEDIFLNRTGMMFTLDTISPTLSGVVHNSYYNHPRTITGHDTFGFSGFLLSGTWYPGNVIFVTSGGTRSLTGYDRAGNTTSVMFTLDFMPPTITGAQHGYLYSGNITLTGNDAVGFSGFLLSGTRYPGNVITITGDGTRIVTGYDVAGNTTGLMFIIDKTGPTFLGAVHNGHYPTNVLLTGVDNNGFSGFLYSGTFYPTQTLFFTGEQIYHITGYDILGNASYLRFVIDKTAPIITGHNPISGTTFSTTSNITFTRSGYDINLSGYTLYITGTQQHGISVGTNTQYTLALPNGTYTWYVVAHDYAGNTTTSIPKSFTIVVPLQATITLLTGNLQYNAAWYSKDSIQVRIQTNKLATYLFTGDIILSPFTGTINGIFTGNLLLSGTDGIKTVYVQVTDGIESSTASFTIRLDTTPPQLPVLLSPISGANVQGSFVLDWSDVLDGGAGLSGFQYIIHSTGVYATIVKSGFTNATTSYATIANGELPSNAWYYWYVKAIDKLGNTTAATPIEYFYYSGTVDTTPNQFTFTDITNAQLNRAYTSNIITITGMTPNIPVLATINRGALYISGNFVGTTGYVQNGWTVNIVLISSNEYNTTVSSTLTIGGVSDTFSVTTKSEDDEYGIETNLSNSEKLMIINIFETLKNLYSGIKEQEFFNTLMVILQHKMNAINNENDKGRQALKYLYDLIDHYYDGGNFGDDISTTRWIVNGVYTAPNGKKYRITYDSTKQRFTSKDFVTPKYFPTLDTLKYIIDINNPVGSSYAQAKPILAWRKNAAIDGTRQTSPYTAPNKKTFYFFKDIHGRFSSYTFTTERWFTSLEEMKKFIYTTNKK